MKKCESIILLKIIKPAKNDPLDNIIIIPYYSDARESTLLEEDILIDASAISIFSWAFTK